MTKNLKSYKITPNALFLTWKGKSVTVQRGALNFDALRAAIFAEDEVAIEKNITIPKALSEWAQGEFQVVGDKFLFRKQELPESLNRRIVTMARAGVDPKPFFKFWEKLKENPSWRSVQQLWGFLSHFNIPLDLEGNILAYKGVNSDYTDCHTGTFDNSPGKVHKMPRNEISDDPNLTCHIGFHVGALNYATSFGPVTVIVKVDPKHVVCIPNDHNAQKMRVEEYAVIGNYSGTPLPSSIFTEEGADLQPVNPRDDDTEDVEEEVDEEIEVEVELENQDDPETDNAEIEAAVAAKASTQPRGREAAKPATKKVTVKKTVTKQVKVTDPDKATQVRFAKYARMDAEQLSKESMDDLRKYATQKLKITGAAKIIGGKSVLIDKIIEIRGRKSGN